MSEIITIDGPGGSGKSTIARMMAKNLGFVYLDTGAMYRAVALAAMRNKIPFDQGALLGDLCSAMNLQFKHVEDASRLLLNNEDISLAIRSPEMDIASSAVSAVKEVRIAMTDLQRRLAQNINVVAEGRDMGTVVFPNAKNKFFLTARPEVRAQRRYLERKGRGEDITFEEVERLLKKRDRQDESRNLAPLKPAEDAIIIDSSDLDLEEVIQLMLDNVRKA
ncbi:MAG TPA: (d)CMP kinase [Deltaproteobacteria bacterium]|nr:(d)CMP kinase [Deltaproteobacteria bacterium]